MGRGGGPPGRGGGRGRGGGPFPPGGPGRGGGVGGGMGRGGYGDPNFQDQTSYSVPADKCGLVIGKGEIFIPCDLCRFALASPLLQNSSQ